MSIRSCLFGRLRTPFERRFSPLAQLKRLSFSAYFVCRSARNADGDAISGPCKVSIGLTCAVSLVPTELSYSLLLALYVDILDFLFCNYYYVVMYGIHLWVCGGQRTTLTYVLSFHFSLCLRDQTQVIKLSQHVAEKINESSDHTFLCF